MIENIERIKEIMAQRPALIKRAGYIVHRLYDWDFDAEGFENDFDLLDDNDDAVVHVYGTDENRLLDSWGIPVKWLFVSEEDVKTLIEERKKKEEEEKKHREEERKERERIQVEAKEREELARLMEKYNVNGGKKDD